MAKVKKKIVAKKKKVNNKEDFSKVLNRQVLKKYARFVEDALGSRYAYQGKVDGADFLAGAMCIYCFLKVGGALPASWVLNPSVAIDAIIEKVRLEMVK